MYIDSDKSMVKVGLEFHPEESMEMGLYSRDGEFEVYWGRRVPELW